MSRKIVHSVPIGRNIVGRGQPCYVIAEIGINHNGSLDVAKRLIDGAVLAGCNAVKFQKRTPELCVPKDQWNVERDTPWGRLTYIEYRHKVELSKSDYQAIAAYCAERKIDWFASPWDELSVDFLEGFDVPCYKVASASVTDGALLERIARTKRPVIMSTGMSTLEEIDRAVALLGTDRLVLGHTTSAYPAALGDLNLRAMAFLEDRYGVPVGYSGHETGLAPTLAAVALGATWVERHITLDRAMWGTDQAASVEVGGMMRLVANIRDVELALGDGVKRVTETERKMAKKLRRVASAA